MNIFGLANCDSTRAAIKWLKSHKQDFEFFDFKTGGISRAKLEEWIKQVPPEKLLNKKSTTWRGLTPMEQSAASTSAGAVDLMIRHTSLIKRPLVEWKDDSITTGYDEAVFNSKINT